MSNEIVSYRRISSVEQIGEALRQRRKQKKLTQGDVSEISTLSIRFLSELERGCRTKSSLDPALLTHTVSRYTIRIMIKSFACKSTEKLFNDFRVKKFDSINRKARIKLGIIEDAVTLKDLEVLPGNRLEALIGDRAGQHSIRINKQWRICFRWDSGHAYDVEIVDYH